MSVLMNTEPAMLTAGEILHCKLLNNNTMSCVDYSLKPVHLEPWDSDWTESDLVTHDWPLNSNQSVPNDADNDPDLADLVE